MKNKISSSLVSEANLDTKIDFLGATITKFFGAVKVHDALEEGRGEEADKIEEYVSKLYYIIQNYDLYGMHPMIQPSILCN